MAHSNSRNKNKQSDGIFGFVGDVIACLFVEILFAGIAALCRAVWSIFD
ncbi:hypothetical protein [Neolewinella antarctica]|uniref:Uncharacterized protein n=1 Tax=Neolewinella antarctica TaxID=442734 RepID=A0ABX0XGG0_9BACT|nr:hypothetical protein [Neolewinella antarctica]NJC28419.1 hypothetical protein [Neolewinella antarctica]